MDNIDESKLSEPVGYLFTNEELQMIVTALEKRPFNEVFQVMFMIFKKVGYLKP